MSFEFSTLWTAVVRWLWSDGLSVAAIIVGALFAHLFLRVLIERVVRRLVVLDHTMSESDERKREDTLIRIIHSTVHVLLIVIVILTVLSTLGVEIGPLLAAAGIAGLAFGFGGQYLIRDVIAGLFIILENQVRVGDVVSLDDTAGVVEDVTLRAITLRDLDGVVHYVPNGTIGHVANMGKEFARINLNVGVSYAADLEHVERVVNRVGQELADDPIRKEAIISPPQFLRVEEFADSAVIIKILGDVRPLKQWEVAGEFRKRLKIAFDREGIEIPFPQQVIRQAA